MISIRQFKKKVWAYYSAHGRHLPWRKNISPYSIWVSEIMLQQTQVPRVIDKYQQFLSAFPTVKVLALASLRDVLALWSGLGYNRRAKFLHQSAKLLANRRRFPNTVEGWQALPGIGHATAAAIMAYAYNEPVVYIETNIRSVFIHEFFPEAEIVSDAELLPLIARAADTKNSREWYWALMDYGTFIKLEQKNPSRRSKQHARQSAFAGSFRQIRGQVIKRLLQQPCTLVQLQAVIADDRVPEVVAQLIAESFITKRGGRFYISS